MLRASAHAASMQNEKMQQSKDCKFESPRQTAWKFFCSVD